MIVGIGLWAAETSRADGPMMVTKPYTASASTAPTHTAIYRRAKDHSDPRRFNWLGCTTATGCTIPGSIGRATTSLTRRIPYGVGFGYPYGGPMAMPIGPYYQSYAYPVLANYNYGGYGAVAYGNGSGYGCGYGGGWPGCIRPSIGRGYPYGMGGSFGPWGGVGYSPYYAGYGGAGYGGYGGYGGCCYW